MSTCRRVAALGPLLLLGVLTACDGQPDGSRPAADAHSSSRPAEQRSASPSGGTGAAQPGEPWRSAPSSGPESAQPGDTTDPGRSAHITGLRLVSRPAVDELVIHLDGADVPEWTAEYVEPAGSGGGDAVLAVSVRAPTRPSGESSTAVGSSGRISSARTTGWVEGREEVLVGVRDGRVPFRAYALSDPGRIVVEVG